MHDPDLHLFVDDREIHQYVHLVRVLNRPRRFAEPVVKPDRPWERGCRAWAWGSVIQEPDGLLRMYYMLFNVGREPGTLKNGNFGYAESRDGFHWEKPLLGLYEFAGSKENNIVFSFGDTGAFDDSGLSRPLGGLQALDRHGSPLGTVTGADGITVLRDDDEPDPGKRYKLIADMQHYLMWARHYPELYGEVSDEEVDRARKMIGQYLLTSPDGFHWTRDALLLKGECQGDYMMVTRDHRNRRWWMNERPRSLTGRAVELATSTSLFDWPEPTESIFAAGPECGFGRVAQWHAGITPFNYGNQDLGLLEHWSVAGLGAYCELASHRDGEPWQRVAPGTIFLDIGPEGSFDRSLAYPLHNAPARVGDKLHIYYSGLGYEPGTDPFGYGAVGVATIGLDRFAGLAHWRGTEPGVVVTKPVTVNGDVLQLNVETHNGQVAVAVKNPDWSEIPGYTWEDSQPTTGDRVRAPASWNAKADVSELRGRRVTLHFRVQSAVLYSYRWSTRHK